MVRIVNVNELGGPLEIVATGQTAEFGEEIDVDDADLAESLIESGLWARPTTKVAKAAAKEGTN
jgi:hypothetical protein